MSTAQTDLTFKIVQSVFSALSQGLDDDFLQSSIGRWADTAATYCPCRPMEHSKMLSSKPCDRAEKTVLPEEFGPEQSLKENSDFGQPTFRFRSKPVHIHTTFRSCSDFWQKFRLHSYPCQAMFSGLDSPERLFRSQDIKFKPCSASIHIQTLFSGCLRESNS